MLREASNHRLARIAVLALLGLLLSGASVARALPMVFEFTFENDGDLTNSPFGTVTVNGDAADRLTFTIDLDKTKLGAAADIHEFGFNLDFVGAITLDPDPTVIDGVTLSLSSNAKVRGRNSRFDWVIGLGNGNPTIDSVAFTVTGTGLDLSDFTNAPLSTQKNKPDAVFMAHIQSTATAVGSISESIGGLASGIPAGPPVGHMPEPSAALLFTVGSLIVGLGVRKAGTLVK